MKEFAIIVSIHLKPGKETVMSRFIVLYCSTYGYSETMALMPWPEARGSLLMPYRGLHRLPCETPMGIVLYLSRPLRLADVLIRTLD